MSNILLVDDNCDLVKIFSLVLSRNGHTVHSAPGGRESIELLATVAPDIILLDIMMPGMDGWETLLAIKQDPATQAIPVTMCSGKLPDLDEINRYGKFIEDYLVKPQELSELSDTLAGIVRRYMDRKEKMECLKHEIRDNHLVDEFYDCQKTLLIIEKFSRFFTADPGKTGLSVQHHITRMNEISSSLNHPVLSAAAGLQTGMERMHSGESTPSTMGAGDPERQNAGEKDINPIGNSSRTAQ